MKNFMLHEDIKAPHSFISKNKNVCLKKRASFNTTSQHKNLKILSLIFFLFFATFNSFGQYYTKHNIAPAPWNYFSDANEIVIATESLITVNIAVRKSDGTLVTNLTAVKGAPAVYRFSGNPLNLNYHALNTVLSGIGLTITSNLPTSVNLRNVASDDLPGNQTSADSHIKGNASLTSFGNAGIGVKFRVGYYRDGSIGSAMGGQLPIYSVMAIENGTIVKVSGTTVATLNAGQSYLFQTSMGALVETSAPSVMNTGARIDTPEACGDGTFDQIPPISVLGTDYYIVRTLGNNTAEQSTIIATEANTVVTISKFSNTGALISSSNVTLANAGSFHTFVNGDGTNSYSSTKISGTKKLVVYSGSAQACEVDISTVAPVSSSCGGSYSVETAKFRNYNGGDLPYFGYVLIQSGTSIVRLNGTNLETLGGTRRQLGTTGWYVIDFTSAQVNNPSVISITSASRVIVSIIQQGGGFSMSAFFSNFVEQPTEPIVAYISDSNCPNGTASLLTSSGFAPYQWYLDGVAIPNATSLNYIASQSGSYSVSATLPCGDIVQSPPVTVITCTDLKIVKTASNPTPAIGSNVTFTITATNLGRNNASNVVVKDILPSGYTFVSATPSVGTWTAPNWNIGTFVNGATATLTIVATVKESGTYANTATITGSNDDPDLTNNTSTTTPTPRKNLIDAVNNTGTSVNGTTGGTSYTNILDNDTLNGSPVVPSQVNLTFVSSTNPGVTLSGTNVVVAAGTPAGNYTLTYQICETAYPSNCDTAVVTVPVGAAAIVANDDTGTSVNGFAGGTSFTNVLGNDTLNGSPVVPSQVNLTFVSSTNPGVTLSGTNVVVAAGTPAGSYTLTYKICQVANPTNCDTAIVTVPVGAPAIVANDDTGTSVNGFAGGTSFTNVLGNDTLNGSAVVPSQVNLTFVSSTNPGVTLSGANVVVAAGTPAGNYTLTYKICQVANPTNCDTAIVTVPVGAPAIVANDDTGTSVNGFAGGTSFTNVLGNDTLNGSAVVPSQVNLTFVSSTNPGVTLSGTNVVVAAGTPAGSYTLTYKICQVANPTNCDTAVVTVPVAAPAIVANDDTGTSVNGFAGGTSFTNVLGNDTLNGSPVVPSQVNLTFVSSTNPGVTLSGANVVVAAGTPAGSYTLTYKICEVANPTNCDTAIVTVPVTATAIIAQDDSIPSTPGAIGNANAGNVFNNNGGGADTLNGSPVVIANVNLTTVTAATPLFTGAPVPSINAAGNVVIPAGTPAGNYTITYQICEKLNPTNCDTAIVTVPVTASPIIAQDDTMPSTNGYSGNNNAGNVFANNGNGNDTLNGNPVAIGQVNLTVTTPATPINGGPIPTINAAGNVVIPAGTPAGSYTITYQICEKLNPSNCDIAIVTIPVAAPAIVANDDAGSSINGFAGGTSFTNVLGNDTLNGSPVVPSQVNLTFVSSTNPGVTLSGANVVVAAGTPAGSYTLTYKICEVANPTNCDTAIVTVPVTATAIIAQDDSIPSTPGAIGNANAGNVFNNNGGGADTLNGSPVVIANVNLTTVTAATPLFTGAPVPSINTAGNVVIPAGTPAGNYTITYQICEKLNPTNCDTAIVTVPVTASPIIAQDDTMPSTNGYTGNNNAGNVFANNGNGNDTLNGNPVTIGQVNLTVTTPATPINGGPVPTINAAGNVVIPAGTPAGSYTITYQICEKLNPTNCDTAIVTIPVGAPAIVANDDTGTSVNGFAGGTSFTNVLGNDTLNGSAVVPSQVNLTFVSSTNPGVTLSGANVVVAAGTPAGNYTLTYQICQIANPTNCDTAIVTVPVGAPAIVANDDTAGPVNGYTGATGVVNVFTNDTLNGIPVVPSQVTLTTTVPNANLILNPNGSVDVIPGTPAGTYTLTYQICQITNPSNCDTAIVTITVGAPAIVANDDAGSSVNGFAGGTSFTNVLGNDTLNGSPVVPSQVNLTFVSSTNPGVTLSGANVVVAAGTPAGNYTLTYQICQIANPTNCDTAIVTVPVGAPAIVANDDTGTSVNGFAGGTSFTNVLGNDTLNGSAVVPSQVNLTFVSSTNPGVTLSGANVVVAAGTPAGNYTLTYQICQIANPTNCDTAIVTVPVGAPAIVANDDTAGPVNGYTGATGVVNVFTNDTLNGIPVVPSQVTLTTTVPNANLILNPNGSVDVIPGTPAGTYTLTYQICQITNPSNCDTAIVTITVGAPAIVANDDAGSSVNGFAGGTSFTNVLGNDTLNGSPVVPSQVNLTFVSSTNPGVTLSGANVVVAAGTPAGNYTLTYQICQIANPTNCDTAIVTVPVGAPAIVANDDTGTSVNGFAGGTSFTNVLGNDTLNGSAVVPSQVNLTFVSSTNPGVTLSGANVVVAAGTPAGNYTLTYQICQIANPTNCDTAIVTVPVGAPAIVANDDTAGPVNGYTGATGVVNVFTNDTLNGIPVVPSQVTLTTTVPNANLILNPNGSVDVIPGTPAGTYTLTYQICQITNPSNCDTAIVTITVGAPAIVANDDAGSSVNGFAGGTSFTNVLGNDTLNGSPVVPSQVNLTFVSSTNPGVTLSGANVVVAAGTPAGNYTLTYQICQIANPTNCDTAIVTVPVGAPAIVANDDTYNNIECVNSGIIGNILSNDSLNGTSPNNANVTLNIISGNNPNISISNSGDITITAGIPAGQYSFEYRICEILNPNNCDNAIITITVIDNTDPTWNSALPSNVTVECNNIPTAETLTASDTCGNATVIFNESITPGNCVNNYTIVRTWTATDASNNDISYTQTITVQDTTAPTFVGNLPSDTTASCDNIPAAAVLTATDACGTATVAMTETRTDGACAGSYTLARTWTATDLCGNTTVHTQTITVSDTAAPAFVEALPADITASCGNIPAAAVLTATDACGTATVAMTETRTDGACAGSYTLARTWTATDLCGNTMVHTQTITVADTTAPAFVEALPADVSVACETIPAAATLTATDACGTATVAMTETRADGACAGSYTLARTWTATDLCGNTTVHTQTITVSDTAAPAFVEALPADITASCGNIPTAAVLTATDACGTATVAMTETRTDGACAGSYTLARTWTATDLCGNTTVHTQTITVSDTAAPAFVETLPADVTVACGAIPAAATLTATDACGTATVAMTETRTDGACAGSYTLARTWTATDLCGNTTVHTQTITVQDTTAPAFVEALPADVSVACGAIPAAATLTATDACGTATVAMTETRTDGACAGSYTLARTWTATDLCGNTTVHTQTITVSDTTAPSFVEALPADVSVACETIPAAATLTATDACGTATVAMTETRADGACAGSYTLARTWTATDLCGNTTVHTQTITVSDTAAPAFVEALPADITASCGNIPAAAVLTATDTCGTATVAMTETRTDGACAGSYTLARTWTATDLCGNTTVHTQTITVSDTTAPAFVEALPANITASCDNIPAAAVLTATDACGTATVAMTETRTDGACAGSYTLARTWTATDLCGNTTVHTQTITVSDTTAPVFVETLPADVTVACGAIPAAATLTATDACGTATVAMTETRTDGACAGSYTLARTWTATDLCGNTTVHTQTITVADTTAPAFVETLPADVTVACGAIPTAATLTATDVCGTATVAMTETRTDGACAGSYTLARTWTATDLCGNTTVHTQTITVADTTAPLFVETVPADVTVACGAIPAAVTLTATDNCSLATVTMTENTVNGACAGDSVITRTWTATDLCGNTTVHTQTITVADTTAPLFVETVPADVTVACGAIPAAVTLTATDNCSLATVTMTENTVNGACAGDSVITRTWTATDLCGNTTSAIQIITVEDNTAPTLITPLEGTINVVCSAIPDAPALQFTDSCSSVENVIFDELIENQTATGYTIIRTWSASDSCGNSSTFTQTVNVTITSSTETIPSELCVEDLSVDLFTLLDGSVETTGTWMDTNNSGGLQGSIFNPAQVALGNYQLSYVIANGDCPRTIQVNMNVNDDCVVLAPCEIIVHNAITPNGDALNEFFKIEGIDCYPNNTVEIYNRWGILVFDAQGYDNTTKVFRGISEGRSTIKKSEELPDGTYFYVLKYVDADGKSREKASYLYINR